MTTKDKKKYIIMLDTSSKSYRYSCKPRQYDRYTDIHVDKYVNKEGAYVVDRKEARLFTSKDKALKECLPWEKVVEV